MWKPCLLKRDRLGKTREATDSLDLMSNIVLVAPTGQWYRNTVHRFVVIDTYRTRFRCVITPYCVAADSVVY